MQFPLALCGPNGTLPESSASSLLVSTTALDPFRLLLRSGFE